MGFFHFSGLVYQASASYHRMHQGSGGRRKFKGWIIAVHGVRAKDSGGSIIWEVEMEEENWCCVGIQQQHASSAQRNGKLQNMHVT
jgi:hypothetical protein